MRSLFLLRVLQVTLQAWANKVPLRQADALYFPRQSARKLHRVDGASFGRAKLILRNQQRGGVSGRIFDKVLRRASPEEG